MRVLVVDDEPDTVLSLVTLLQTEGHEAKGLSNGARAVAEVAAFDPDVVIVDIAMPGMNGWDVAREVRRTTPRRPVLIAISGTYGKMTDIIMSRAAGFSHFLQKPCNPSFLFNILSAVAPGR